MTQIVQVQTTTEQSDQAKAIADHLVQQQLAACVQIDGPIQSVYRWQGTVCCAEEFRCTIKSADYLLEQVIASIEQTHPYDVPEIIVSKVDGSSESYHAWLLEQLQPPQ